MVDLRQYKLAHTHITAIRNSFSRTVRIMSTSPNGTVTQASLILGANVRGAGTQWEIPIHSEIHNDGGLNEPYLATEFEIPGHRTRHFHTLGRFLKPGDEIVAHVTYSTPQGITNVRTYNSTESDENRAHYWVTLDLVVERHTSRGSQSHWFNMLVVQIPYSNT